MNGNGLVDAGLLLIGYFLLIGLFLVVGIWRYAVNRHFVWVFSGVCLYLLALIAPWIGFYSNAVLVGLLSGFGVMSAWMLGGCFAKPRTEPEPVDFHGKSQSDVQLQ